MKRFLFIYLMLCPLWACPSCQDEDKLPGSKPEILFGKWENFRDAGWSYNELYLLTTYEFTKTGGSINKKRYLPSEDRYEEYHTKYFTDWSYDGEYIHFIYKKNSVTDEWRQPVYELASDYFRLGIENSVNIYYKIK